MTKNIFIIISLFLFSSLSFSQTFHVERNMNGGLYTQTIADEETNTVCYMTWLIQFASVDDVTLDCVHESLDNYSKIKIVQEFLIGNEWILKRSMDVKNQTFIYVIYHKTKLTFGSDVVKF